MILDFITWDADPIIIDSFVTVRWYGLMFAIGFLIGYSILYRMFRHEGAPERWMGSILLWTVAGTVLGARLGHVFSTSGTGTRNIPNIFFRYGRADWPATEAQ